jgi:predicted DNA-binding protein (UPF0251 family)
MSAEESNRQAHAVSNRPDLWTNREHDAMSEQNSTAVEISRDELAERIRHLAAQGLKPRDISALLGIHPQIVLRVLGEAQSHAG